jgi:hypothetical protein
MYQGLGLRHLYDLQARIFLQVECLSDITDTTGKHILKAWTRHDGAKPSRSTKRWPKQADPGTEAWSIWKKYLTLAFTDEHLKLCLPLGPWIKMNDSREHYAYWENTTENLITKTNKGPWASFSNGKGRSSPLLFQQDSEGSAGIISNPNPADHP